MPFELITSEEVAAFAGVANDSTAQRITAAVIAWCERKTGRTFERKSRTAIVRGYGSSVIFLPERPIHQITEVRVDACGEFGADAIVTDLTKFLFDSAEDSRVWWSDGYFPEGPRVAKVTFLAGYYDITAAAENVPKVPQDLREALINEAAQRIKRNGAEKMKSASAGAYSYTRFDTEVDPAVQEVIRGYRNL